MVKLKTDPNLPHHYIIGMGMHGLEDKNPGELYLKYGPVYFTNEDIKRLGDAIMLSEDKLFPTTNKEALKITETSSLVHNLSSMKMAASVNMVTLHHFSSSFKIKDERHFEDLIKQSNKSTYIKEKLIEAKI
jgi:hypothetical protein